MSLTAPTLGARILIGVKKENSFPIQRGTQDGIKEFQY